MGCCQHGFLPILLLLHAMEDPQGIARVLGIDVNGFWGSGGALHST